MTVCPQVSGAVCWGVTGRAVSYLRLPRFPHAQAPPRHLTFPSWRSPPGPDGHARHSRDHALAGGRTAVLSRMEKGLQTLRSGAPLPARKPREGTSRPAPVIRITRALCDLAEPNRRSSILFCRAIYPKSGFHFMGLRFSPNPQRRPCGARLSYRAERRTGAWVCRNRSPGRR